MALAEDNVNTACGTYRDLIAALKVQLADIVKAAVIAEAPYPVDLHTALLRLVYDPSLPAGQRLQVTTEELNVRAPASVRELADLLG